MVSPRLPGLMASFALKTRSRLLFVGFNLYRKTVFGMTLTTDRLLAAVRRKSKYSAPVPGPRGLGGFNLLVVQVSQPLGFPVCVDQVTQVLPGYGQSFQSWMFQYYLLVLDPDLSSQYAAIPEADFIHWTWSLVLLSNGFGYKVPDQSLARKRDDAQGAQINRHVIFVYPS